ncbi:hypothetical protein JCM10212_006714 [Sporobolomyces blumeae]
MCGIAFQVRLLRDQAGEQAGESGWATSAPRPALSTDRLDRVPARADGSDDWDRIVAGVRDRGPDSHRTLTRFVTLEDGATLELRFHASVLHLRGKGVTVQPFENDETGDVLLWNGEIFDSLTVDVAENDGKKFFDLVESSSSLASPDSTASTTPQGFLRALRQVDGPHAFVYYQAKTKMVWFARDALGRRSLVVRNGRFTIPPNDGGGTRGGMSYEDALTLASTIPRPERREFDGQGQRQDLEEAGTSPESGAGWEEVDCSNVYALDLQQFGSMQEGAPWRSYPRQHLSEAGSDYEPIYPFDRLNRSLPGIGDLLPMTRSFPPQPVISPAYMNLAHEFLEILEQAVRERVLTIPHLEDDSAPARAASGDSGTDPRASRVAVLFSGGLDCSTIAMLVDKVLPRDESIDLINVAFENPRKVHGSAQASNKPAIRPKRQPDRRTATEDEASVPDDVPTACRSTTNGSPFDDVRTGSGATASSSVYDVPDRLTGRASWSELCRLCPDRRWNFVEVDVPYEEMTRHRQDVIDLMRPQNTVMDLSIAIAFYFAARGQGFRATVPPVTDASGSEETPRNPLTSRDDERQAYTSRARVLLSGLGADELLGGYLRHRKAYNHGTGTRDPPPLPDSPEGHVRWLHLVDELELDLSRLSTRNLGRDDRVVSSVSKEVRYPFLAAPVVRFLTALAVWHKCDMRFPEGSGDKLLLRTVARGILGLDGAARLKKRAIHFGARTAKMEVSSGKAKGTDTLE